LAQAIFLSKSIHNFLLRIKIPKKFWNFLKAAQSKQYPNS
jgi:hypothetical protein